MPNDSGLNPTGGKPLSGVRVLEFSGYISAPYAGAILASLGADVVKVERPQGEEFRRGLDDRSLYFRQYNAGKRSLAVNLKDAGGVRLVRELLPRFDVLIENQRPGKMAALGLGRDDCVAVNPAIVYTSITGFGSGGPWSQRPAYDTIGQAFGGIMSVLSDEDSMQLSGTCLADLVTGLCAVTGVLAALLGRSRNGRSVFVETSIAEALSSLTIDALTQLFDDGYRDPSRQSRHPQGGAFCLRTKSSESVAVHLSSSQKFWDLLTQAIERPELAQDERFATYNARVSNYRDLVALLEPEFLKRDYAEWERILVQFDVPFSPVNSLSRYRDNEQIEWLEVFEPVRDGLALVRPPWRFDGVRPDRSIPTPKLGEHTREVAGEVYDDARIDDLVADGVLHERR